MTTKNQLAIREGLSGTWFYHLGDVNESLALCGAQVMSTELPLSAWGQRGHLHERYCSRCAQNENGARAIAAANGVRNHG